MGYENLALTNQNLRDQPARLENTLGNVAETISRRVGIRENLVGIPSVHNEDARGLLESSARNLVSINSNQLDFTNREIDTRTKKRPTGEDIENMDKVIGELMKQNVINPSEHPFSYL